MNNITKIIAVLFAVCIVSFETRADITLPATIEIRKPKLLQNPIVKESEITKFQTSGKWGQDDVAADRLWEVYSDRANNKTYMSPSMGSPLCGSLQFNQKVRIARIENGFALVYHDPKTDGTRYSNEAKSLGWIPMRHLLLWEHCPVNNHEIYRKALLTVNVDKVHNKQDLKRAGYVYADPARAVKLGQIVTDLKFYYVMKKDPSTGLVLLAYSYSLIGASNKMLYGWVEPNAFVAWNQRSCLEPNWEEDLVEEFNSPRGKKYPIYFEPIMTSASIGSYYMYGVQNPDETKYSPYRYRMQPEKVRFPILDNDSKNDALYKLTSFGLGGRKVVNSASDSKEAIEIERKAQELTQKMQNINLIFVIDGTASMKQYFLSVKGAIQEGLKYFNDKKYKPRVGIVIYRDYADGNALIETLPLVDPARSATQLNSFLDNVGRLGYGAKSAPTDKSYAEALYVGINAGLDAQKMGYDKDQANLMIVVGDCGNAVDDARAPAKEDIIKKLIDNNIQLMSHQVRRNSKNSSAWQLFNTQMIELVVKNMEGQYSSVGSKPKFVARKDGIGYDVGNAFNDTYFFGSIRLAKEQNSEMDPRALTDLIEDNIGSFAQYAERMYELYQNMVNGYGFIGGETSAGNTEMSENIFINRLGLSRDEFERFKDSGASMAYSGYAPKYDSQGRPYWKPVVLLSGEELSHLIKRLEPAYEVAKKGNIDGNNRDLRKRYIDALRGIVKALISDISDDKINDMSLDEVSNIIHGLNESSTALQSYTLAQLAEPQIVKAEEFRGMLSDFKQKVDGLKFILSNKNYKYKFEQNVELSYYWIPIEDLP